MQPSNKPTVLQQFTSSSSIATADNGETPEASSGEVVKNTELARQYGAYGSRIFQGFISGEEYLPELQGHAGLAVFDEMRKSDATVKASLRLLVGPLMGADWYIEEASDDPQDLIVAEFVRYNFFERLKWRRLLEEALLCLPLGYAVFEKSYDWFAWPGLNGKGGGQFRCIDKISSRKQDTIFSWQQANGEPGVNQITPTGGTFDIPADKLLIFTHEREGQNFAGNSVLRSAYKHWFIKAGLEKTMAIAAERQGVGVPFYEAPTGATTDELNKADTAMKNLRANEQSFLRMPIGWKYGFMDMMAQGNFDPMPQIQYHNRQILLNVLGQHLDQGSSGASGSRASSQTHNQILDQALEAIAVTVIEDEFNENLVKQLVDLNFTVKNYPKLRHKGLSDDNATTLPDALQKLAAAGLITPDPELEESLRETFKLTPLPDDIKNDYANRPQANAAVPPIGAVVPAKPVGKVTPPAAPAATPQPASGKNDDIQASDALAQAKAAHMQLIRAAERLYAEPASN